MDWGILLGVVGVLGIPLALAILGLTMAINTSGELNFVRACFIGAALISAVTVFLLYWNYTEGSQTMRVLSAAIAGAVIFAGLAAALNWVDRKQPFSDSPTQKTSEALPGKNNPNISAGRDINIGHIGDVFNPPPKEEHLTGNEGVLEPSDLPMPSIPTRVTVPDDAMVIFAAGGVHWTQGSSITVFKMAGDDMLTVERRNGSVLITVLRIYDANGIIIARIDEDGFWVAPHVRKKRPDKSTLIVFDQMDVQVLNLKLLNTRAISVQALLRNPKKPGVSVSVTNQQVEYLPNHIIFRAASSGNASSAFSF